MVLIPGKYQNLEGLFVTFSESELKLAVAIAEAIKVNSGSGSGDASATNQQSQIALETAIRDRLPSALVGGRLAVDVQSLNVTVNNAQLEISNDVGNPIPVNGTVTIANSSIEIANDVGNPVPISGNSLTSIDNKTPALGATTAANSQPVTLANDGVFITNFGWTTDTAAISDTVAASFVSLFRRLLAQVTILLASVVAVRDRLMPQGILIPYLGTSAGANIKTSAGSFYAFTCTNTNTTIRYFQIFNKASAPATNDVPITYFPVYGNNGFLLIGQDILGGAGIDSTILTNGVAWGISTTAATYTAATAAEHSVTVRYS